MDQTLTFLVPGREEKTRSGTAAQRSELAQATVVQSIRLDRTRGSADELIAVHAVPGRDIVVLDIQNGPRLYLHPENARDLFLAQQQRPGQRGGEAGKLELPTSLDWPEVVPQPGRARGLSKVVANTLDLLRGDYLGPVADWASSEIVSRVDSQVEPGLYALGETRLPGQLKDYAQPVARPDAGAGPMLVFIHGTFSSTYGTFARLWDHPQLVQNLFRHYGNKVYALEHKTLAASPIENALALANAVPVGTRLHLLTHSRGGLVAEVLARACGNPDDVASASEFFENKTHQTQFDQLQELLELVRRKKLTVERVVRVACPARGTLLASRRLDAYLSVLKWTLELAGIPVAPALVEFIGAVAQHRADPQQIPGLAAQMPDSPLVQWLHAAEDAVPGELRVVAGDVIGDSIGSWIKTLVSDAYYWQDNDFVVQTSSMYGGVPRAPDATFFLARSGDVSHFSYFARPETAGHIVDGLIVDSVPQFARIGPQSKAGESSSGTRALRQARGTRGGGERPAVIVLPGILGSHLRIDDRRVWISLQSINGLRKLRYGADDMVVPDGAIDHYEDLMRHLEDSHDVIEFSYDWRKPIELEAGRLAEVVMQALASRRNGQPVRILAHSMGGLVARVMQIIRPNVWDAMFQNKGARLLMLGTPNGGSWAPMQMLSGDDDFGNWLTLLGAPFAQNETRQVIANFPGFLQMQAGLLDAKLDLASSGTWSRLAALDAELLKGRSFWHNHPLQLSAFAWGIPSQPVLDEAVALRLKLDAQAGSGWAPGEDAVVMVVGNAEFTPDGFEPGKDGIVYREATKGGDGRVTLPAALLPGVKAWKLDCEHGDLPREKDAFEAYLDLLATGRTARLAQLGASERGRAAERAATTHVSRYLRQGHANRPDLAAGFAVALEPELVRSRREPVLEVRITNGNLKFVGHPIIVGHYSSSQLTGTERTLDELIGGAMSATLDMGCYPNACGTHQIFTNLGVNPMNPLQMPRPEAVLVVGLGLEGAVTLTDLTKTVARGVVAWSQRLRENRRAGQAFEIAATLIGSGGVNLSPESSARAVARGVARANTRLRELGWPTVGCLHFVEVYLDRATEAMRALRLLAEAEPGRYAIHHEILSGTGPQRRALGSGYRGAHYDLISALHERFADGSDMIVYSLNSRRAREDVHATRQQARLIDLLIKNAASNTGQVDPHIGNTLFKLLVPPEIEPFLATSEEMQIELNDRTAAIPWELLDSERRAGRHADTQPWAIRSKLLRCLRTVGLPLTVNDAPGDAHFLVIGEPESKYPSLPGARREADAVARILEDKFTKASVMRLIQGESGARQVNAPAVVGALLERDWRVVHIAGHGALPASKGEGAAKPDGSAGTVQSRGGVVLSDDSFLGADEIAAMRVVPALVFVNCCHLGKIDGGEPGQALPAAEMPGYAATVAEALIRKGVRCVLVAGWAVDDEAARIFAECFYERMSEGARFIDAVADARSVARGKGGNTWAAYQCYGDPNWTLTSGTCRQSLPDSPFEGIGDIASVPALVLALESIITTYRYEGRSAAATLNVIEKLAADFEARWGAIGIVAEAFGLAYFDLNDYDNAVKWLRCAVEAEDATASMRAVEKLGNVLARQAWRRISEANDLDDGSAATIVEEVRAQLETAVGLLEKVLELSATTERHALLGSAYKRLAMVQQALEEKGWEDTLEAAIGHYRLGREKALRSGQEWYYPDAHARIARMVLDSSRRARPPFDDAEQYHQALREKKQRDPDFFSAVAVIEAGMFDAIAQDRLAGESADILRQLRDLHMRARGVHFWGPVLDQFDFVDRLWKRSVPQAERAARNEVRAFLRQCQL